MVINKLYHVEHTAQRDGLLISRPDFVEWTRGFIHRTQQATIRLFSKRFQSPDKFVLNLSFSTLEKN